MDMDLLTIFRNDARCVCEFRRSVFPEKIHSRREVIERKFESRNYGYLQY